MSIIGGPKIPTDGLYFYINGRSEQSNVTGSFRNLVNGAGNLQMVNTPYNSSGFYEFYNLSNVSSVATGYGKSFINDTNFALKTGSPLSVFVTFYNLGPLSTSLPAHYRQIPFGWGTDSAVGQWNMERFLAGSAITLRYKFDQEPTFGSTISFGTVDYSGWNQLGFVNDNNLVKLYKNGAQVASLNIASKTNTGAISPSASLGLGCMADTGVNRLYGWWGYISNAYVYTGALSEEQIRDNYYLLGRGPI